MSTTQANPFAALPARIQAKIAPPDENGCCVWTGCIQKNGYGRVYHKGMWLVHRLVYTLLVGPIPDGLTIDHVKARGCRSKACCTIEHLEVITRRENTLRSGTRGGRQKAKTHCPHGHAYDEANTHVNSKGHRNCRTCRAASNRARYARAIWDARSATAGSA